MPGRNQRLLWGLVVAVLLRSADAATPSSERERNLERLAAWNAEQQRLHGESPTVLLRPGLLADREGRRVMFCAEATGLQAGEPVEFALIAMDSGHDYEALAVSFARPSDVHEALEFIGLSAGRPAQPGRLRFWPKGERVAMRFAWAVVADGHTNEINVSAEELLWDKKNGRAPTADGWVFVGSLRLPQAGKEGAYAADVTGPRSIASTYNEATTVLDRPAQAPQSQVYGRFLPNPERILPAGAWLEVILTPLASQRRVRDLRLEIAERTEQDEPASGLRWRLLEGDCALNEEGTLAGFLATIGAMTEVGEDPFVTVWLDPALRLDRARECCAMVAAVEGEQGLRVEPPPEGHPYYRAFLPDENLRDAKRRMVQPLEAHMAAAEGGTTGTLRRFEQSWDDPVTGFVAQVSSQAFQSPAELAAALRPDEDPSTIFFFAEPAMSYGTLLPYLEPALAKHMTVYVFLIEPAPEKPPLGEASEPVP